jgi:hypothetical protein
MNITRRTALVGAAGSIIGELPMAAERLPTPEEAAQSYRRKRYAQAVVRFENNYGYSPGPFDIEICVGFDCYRSGFSWTVF